MARGMPSLAALLGVLAVAGYQNRDKLTEMLGGAGRGVGGPAGPGGRGAAAGPGAAGGLGGLLEGLSGTSPGGFLSGGLRDLVDRFTQNGQGEVAQSWVGRGPNREIAPPDLERAIGPDVLDALAQRTGLSREELLSRLSRELPSAVDRYTPEGRIPSEAEWSR
jgi:uncharacterized protein YidB (DUF937 family)